MKNGIIITALLVVWTAIKLFAKLLKTLIQVLASLVIFFGLYIPLFYAVFGIVLLAATDFTFGGIGTDQILYFIGLGLCALASVFISIRNLVVRPLSSVFEPWREYRAEMKKKKAEKTGEEDPVEPSAAMQSYADPRAARYYGQPAYYPPYAYPADRAEQGGYQERMAPHTPYYGEYSGGNAYGQTTPRYYGAEDGAAQYAPAGYGETGTRYAPAQERPLVYYSKRRPGILVKEYSDRFELFEESGGARRYIGTEYKDE